MNDASGLLKTAIEETSTITLPYSVSVFSFKFEALNYFSPQKNQYAYRMIGFDKSWNRIGNKNEATYTNLDPGDYTFQVIASNNDGVWNTKGTSIHLIITPPFWMTVWFRILVALIGIVTIFGIFSNRIRAIKNKNVQLEKLVKKRTNEIIMEREKQKVEEEKNRMLQYRHMELEAENLKIEKEVILLKNEKYLTDIQKKNAELAAFAIQIAQKNEFMGKQKQFLEQLILKVDGDIKRLINHFLMEIESTRNLEKEWDQYEKNFELVHENFIQRLKIQYPDITPKDIRLCTYLKLNISTKEISNLLSISVRGVEKSRSRLRKKLNLPIEVDLAEFMLHF